MAPEGVHVLSLRKGETNPNGIEKHWSYSNRSRTPGAFRAISVHHLRKSPPKIKLYEWPDLRYPNSKAKNGANYPAYAAISHVWEQSQRVKYLAQVADSDLVINIEGHKGPSTHTISWLGLGEIANAAHQLKCTHIWLDFMSLDQVPRPDPLEDFRKNDGEKELQISNMATIYKHAKTVIVMVGGVSAVQGVNYPTNWMDRAWTLQEAVLCYKNTWAYVYWPYTLNFSYGANTFKFIPVAGETDKCLIKLRQLLEMPDLTTTTTTPPTGTPSYFKEVCLDGRATGSAVGTARSALLAVFEAKNKEWRRAGIWRSMLLRTSTYPVDIAYSVMGLFDVELDPYRKDRDVQYLFNDLATKTAAKGSPGWLGVGSLKGSLIHRDPRSGIIPDTPIYRGQKLPVYKRGGKKALTGEFVDHSDLYIRRFDIKFITSSLPHVICARMSKFTITNGPVKYGPHHSRVFFTIGTCTYRREIGDRFVVVGKIESWSDPSSPYFGCFYILFVAWDDNKSLWSVSGDGYLRLKSTSTLSKNRTHFIIGRGSPDIKTWPCDHNKTMEKTLHRSYGIMPRPDLSVKKRIPIKWIGYKGDDVTMFKTWHTFNLFFDSAVINQAMEMGLELPKSWPLYLVACNSRNPPNYPDEAQPNSLFKYNKIPMQYTDIDLKLAGLDVWLKMAASGVQLSALSYRATIQFRKHVVYLITEPDKNTDPDFRHIAVAKYKMMNSDPVRVAPITIPPNIPFRQPMQQFDQSRFFYPTSDQEWRDLYNRMGATGDIANFIASMLPRFGFNR